MLPNASIPKRLSMIVENGLIAGPNLNNVPDRINSAIKIYGAHALAQLSFLTIEEMARPKISAT